MALTTLASGSTWGTYRAALNAMLAEIYAALNGLTVNAQTGTTYTLALADVGQEVDMSNAAANVVTVPTNAFVAIPVNTVITVCQMGAGATSIAAASGVTFVMAASRSLTISTQYETAMLRKTATNTWLVACN